jgi:hypothetical protein
MSEGAYDHVTYVRHVIFIAAMDTNIELVSLYNLDRSVYRWSLSKIQRSGILCYISGESIRITLQFSIYTRVTKFIILETFYGTLHAPINRTTENKWVSLRR